MAPRTKRTQPAGPGVRASGKRSQTTNIRKSQSTGLKSAQQSPPSGPRRSRVVAFRAGVSENAGDHYSPPTSSSTATQVPSSSRGVYSRALVDYSKRLEKEKLLKRAAKALGTNSEGYGIESVSQPPHQPPQLGRKSPFDELKKPRQQDQSGRESKAERPSANEISGAQKNDSPDKSLSQLVDGAMDDIPKGTELPDSIDNILNEPNTSIKMEEICAALDHLKAEIQTHCRQFYSYGKPAKRYPTPFFSYLWKNIQSFSDTFCMWLMVTSMAGTNSSHSALIVRTLCMPSYHAL